MSVRETIIEEEDWRGIIAETILVGYFASIISGFFIVGVEGVLAVLGTLTTPVTLVVKWYFDAKEKKKE